MPATAYQSHAANLRSARKRSFRESAQRIRKNAAKGLATASLLKYIDPFIDWLFGIALILAILKDLLDIINTALIAIGGLGELLIIIFTLFISIFIFLIMAITGSVGKVKIAKNIIKRIMLLIATAISEMIPAVGLLPMKTILVIIVFFMTLNERRKGSQLNS